MGGTVDPDFALTQARAFSGLSGKDLTKEVSCSLSYAWQAKNPFHVVVLDFGVKSSILQNLIDSGCHLTIVPTQLLQKRSSC